MRSAIFLDSSATISPRMAAWRRFNSLSSLLIAPTSARMSRVEFELSMPLIREDIASTLLSSWSNWLERRCTSCAA